MRLLLTNDDSIECFLLHALVHALQKEGHELCIVAPRHEQSWTGASKSRRRAVASAREDRGLGCLTWIVDGTPSDCVNIGIAHLLPQSGFPTPDAVISGINVGFNASLGFINASGTIAGAWEGAVHGLPGIAISQDLTFAEYDRLTLAKDGPSPELRETLHHSAARAAALVPELVATTPRQSFIVHNVNLPYPCTPAAVVRRTVPARVIVPALFSPAADDGTHRFVFSLGQDISPAEPLTDRAAIAAGDISHTILDYTRLGTPL